jgi:abhydrolase domain-containing protein 14
MWFIGLLLLTAAAFRRSGKYSVKRERVSVEGELVSTRRSGNATSEHVCLLLHGAKFNAETWEKTTGTLGYFDTHGVEGIAVDIPHDKRSDPTWLHALIEGLHVQNPKTSLVVVAPSMSGQVAIPELLKQEGPSFAAFVGVAPVLPSDATDDAYANVKVPVLAVYGSQDTSLGTAAAEKLSKTPNHEVYMVQNAGHPCYLPEYGHTEEFNAKLVDFVKKNTKL